MSEKSLINRKPFSNLFPDEIIFTDELLAAIFEAHELIEEKIKETDELEKWNK
ncbi:hypothetical protein KAR91_61815 [Candidatus Pacearchaeota archaeon]|nr:hypothetical protein [Candidatus Pacearchaeota archaeon]